MSFIREGTSTGNVGKTRAPSFVQRVARVLEGRSRGKLSENIKIVVGGKKKNYENLCGSGK